MITKVKGYGAWEREIDEEHPLPRCSSDACRQGREQCPTPVACRICSEPDDSDDGIGCVRGLVAAVGLTVLVLVLAGVIAFAY